MTSHIDDVQDSGYTPKPSTPKNPKLEAISKIRELSQKIQEMPLTPVTGAQLSVLHEALDVLGGKKTQEDLTKATQKFSSYNDANSKFSNDIQIQVDAVMKIAPTLSVNQKMEDKKPPELPPRGTGPKTK